ncbi:hypothetical protein D3C80_1092360 [compost metagenome]
MLNGDAFRQVILEALQFGIIKSFEEWRLIPAIKLFPSIRITVRWAIGGDRCRGTLGMENGRSFVTLYLRSAPVLVGALNVRNAGVYALDD